MRSVGLRKVLIHENEIVQGTLKGHDQLMNLVLDDVQEMLRGVSVPAFTSFTSLVLYSQSVLHLLTGTGYR